MHSLLALAARCGDLLKARGETLAVAESSAGGLISAALLAAPGASAWYLGGAVVYTAASRVALLGIGPERLARIRPATEAYALLLARSMRERLGAHWGLAETGATGPNANRYGDPPGHGCFAVCGPREARFTLETGDGQRHPNMHAFARCALELLRARLDPV